MQRLVAAVVVAVRVDLDHERKTFHPLLRGEVCTQTVDRDEDLTRTRTSKKPLCDFAHSSDRFRPIQSRLESTEKDVQSQN